MGDYLFELIDEDATKEFVNLLYEEELWFNTKSSTEVVVISIFDETAAYLYDWLDAMNLRKKSN